MNKDRENSSRLKIEERLSRLSLSLERASLVAQREARMQKEVKKEGNKEREEVSG